MPNFGAKRLINNSASNFQLLVIFPPLRWPLNEVLDHEWIVSNVASTAESKPALGYVQKRTV
jgi:hypothetical protein